MTAEGWQALAARHAAGPPTPEASTDARQAQAQSKLGRELSPEEIFRLEAGLSVDGTHRPVDDVTDAEWAE